MERQRARSTQEIASLIPIRIMEEMLAEPLPSPWSYGVTQDGRVFFINEESQSTTWLHPGFNHPVQTGHLYDQGLPGGWEVNITSGDVLYYIDHINRSTTFNFPEGEVQPLTRSKEKKSSFRFQRSSSKRKSGKQKVIDKMASVKRDVDAPVSIKGWLNRQEVSGPLKTWKRRWCVLADFCLFFYKGSDEGQVLGSLLLPSFKVNPCVKDEDGISKRCAFKAEHENVKTTFFYADTDEEFEKWIEAMRAASNAQFHSIDDDDVRFQRSQSQNAISSRPGNAQNSPGGAKDDEEFGFNSQYGRRQNSMPSGIDLVRQNTDAGSDGNRPRAGDQPYGRDGKIMGDAGLMKNPGTYNPEPPYVSADKRDVSSSEDDLLYVKDLNLSQRPAAVADLKEKNVQPTGPSLDQTYRPGIQNPNMANFYAEDRKNAADSQFKNNSSVHGRYPHRPERGFLDRSPSVPVASHQASYMSSGAEINQKLSPSAKSPNSSNQNNFVYSPVQDLKSGSVGVEGRTPGEPPAAGLYLDASRSGGMNSEAELLDAIRNQKIDRAPADVSGSQAYPEARLRSPGRALDHADSEHQTIAEAKEKFPASFDLRSGAPHHRVVPAGRLENPGGQAWSAKQLGRLEVEAPLSRVEEWTMEQRRQHQELQMRQEMEAGNGERLPRGKASDIGQSGYHDPISQPNVETHWKPESNMGSSPAKINRPDVDTAGAGGQNDANPSVNAQLPRFKMQGAELGVGQFGQKNSNYGNHAPEIHKHVNHKEHDRNPAYSYHGNQPAVSNRSQDSSAEFTARPPLASQNNFAKSSLVPGGVPVLPGTGSQPGKLETVLDTGDAQGSFADINRYLSENARLCQECSSINTQQGLNIDTLIDRLIKLRRNQMKLEEGRYALLGRIHVHMMQASKDPSRASVKAVQDKLSEVEGQIADTNALISELDRKLSNLRSAELSGMKPTTELTFSSQGQSADSEKLLPPGHAADKQPSPSSLTPSGIALDTKTEKGHQEAYALRRQLEQESNFVNNLREEKSRLEKALSKTMRDEQLEKDPNNLLGIRRQKQAIDRELYSLQTKLTFAVKNLENIKKRCVQMDQDTVNMQNHNSEKANGNALSANKSFSMSVSPGAADGRSNDFGGSGSTYFETDLDTGRCLDLGLVLQKSGAQGNQVGFDVRQKGDGRQPQAFSQMRTVPGDIPDRNKEPSTRSNHSSIPQEKQVGIAKNPSSAGAENSRDMSNGRFRGLEREPYMAPEELAARQNQPSDSRYRAAKGDDSFYGNSNPGYFPVSADHSAGAETKFKASSDYPNWNNPPNLGHNRMALPSANPSRLPEGPVLGTEGGPHRTGQYEISLGHSRGVDRLSPAAPLCDASPAQQWNNSRPSDVPGSSIVHEKRGTDGTNQSNIGATVRNERTNNAHGQSFNDYNAGRNADPGMQETWNPVKPPRLPAESREWQRGTELRSNFSNQNMPGHPSQYREDKSKVADYGSSDENMNTVIHKPRSKSLSREWDDQLDQSNRMARNLDGRDYHQGVDAEQGQSSPTGGIGPRDRIRRMSGFFTPKPFKGGGSATSSAQTNTVDDRNNSADTRPLQNESYDQHIDQIFYPPQKVEIPQQYNEDHANETLSPEEAQLRREKAEKFRKMIAAQSLQDFTKGELTTQSGGLHHRVQDERRRREQMLDTRQLLAKEVSRRTRQGSDSAPRVHTVEELLKYSDDGQYL